MAYFSLINNVFTVLPVYKVLTIISVYHSPKLESSHRGVDPYKAQPPTMALKTILTSHMWAWPLCRQHQPCLKDPEQFCILLKIVFLLFQQPNPPESFEGDWDLWGDPEVDRNQWVPSRVQQGRLLQSAPFRSWQGSLHKTCPPKANKAASREKHPWETDWAACTPELTPPFDFTVFCFLDMLRSCSPHLLSSRTMCSLCLMTSRMMPLLFFLASMMTLPLQLLASRMTSSFWPQDDVTSLIKMTSLLSLLTLRMALSLHLRDQLAKAWVLALVYTWTHSQVHAHVRVPMHIHAYNPCSHLHQSPCQRCLGHFPRQCGWGDS